MSLELPLCDLHVFIMQLPLGPGPHTEQLQRIQNNLVQHFGRLIRPPEKRRDPVWALVQGVIGARTKTAISNENTDRLLAKYGSWEAVADVPADTLAADLATATFPQVAGERLKACLTAIKAQRGRVDLSHLEDMDTLAAMNWLETLPGVARKVSAGVVNTSTLGRKALVIDSNHRRVIQRVGLVPAKADTARAYEALEPVLPAEWTAADIDEHHLLVKRVGQTWCRPSRTDCPHCPLQSLCRTAEKQLPN